MGGTSLSAPSWAGLIALADQGRAGGRPTTLGSNGGIETQQALYSLSASDYNAITSGINGVQRTAGYNLVTGLGTPVANLLVPDLIAYQGTSPTNATASASGGAGTGQGFVGRVQRVQRGTWGQRWDRRPADRRDGTAGASRGGPGGDARGRPQRVAAPGAGRADAPPGRALFHGYSQGTASTAEGPRRLSRRERPVVPGPGRTRRDLVACTHRFVVGFRFPGGPSGQLPCPDMPADGSDDLMVGGAGDLVPDGGDGPDLLGGVFAGPPVAAGSADNPLRQPRPSWNRAAQPR